MTFDAALVAKLESLSGITVHIARCANIDSTNQNALQYAMLAPHNDMSGKFPKCTSFECCDTFA